MAVTWTPCSQHCDVPLLTTCCDVPMLITGCDVRQFGIGRYKGTLRLPDVVVWGRLGDGGDLGPLLTLCV
jgi:hypothetical protein